MRIRPNKLPQDQLSREEALLGQEEGKHPTSKAANLLDPVAPSGACCIKAITACVTSTLAFAPRMDGISRVISHPSCSSSTVRPESFFACTRAVEGETTMWHCQEISYKTSFCSVTTWDLPTGRDPICLASSSLTKATGTPFVL